MLLFVVAGDRHASSVVVQRMHRHALINIVVRDLDLPRKLNVVVREFTNLNVINTKSLLFLSCTQTQCRQEFADKVQCAQDQASADERVCAAGE